MFRDKKGFTLIELMVVVSIMILLSALLLADFRSGQRRYVLNQSVQRLASDLRKAQNMAMGGVDVAVLEYYGFGIETNPAERPTSYRFYADKNGDQEYDDNDDILETVTLVGGVMITSASSFDIFFASPFAATFINKSNAPGIDGLIKIEIPGFGLPARFARVNTSGLIQIE